MLRQLALVLCLPFISCGCSAPGRIIGTRPSDLEQPGAIQVWFNHRRGARYRSPLSGQWRTGDDLEEQLISPIDQATQEIQAAVQELSLPRLAQSLIAAHQRGVRVQIVLENTYSTPWTAQQPTHLPQHQQQRWYRLQRLADLNQDGDISTEEALQGDAVALLRRAGIAIVDDTDDGSRGSGLMHHKVLVIDRAVVI